MLTKYCLPQTIMDKDKEIKYNWPGIENSNFCEIFDCYWQILISERETGHWAFLPPKFKIFLRFINFLILNTFDNS